MKSKIIIDLDVVTVALWDSTGDNSELARKFLARVDNKEFYVATPFLLIELVLKWKHENLKNIIKDFYVKNSDRLLTDSEIKDKCSNDGIDFEKVLTNLESTGIKNEDAALILIASLFSFDCLVTFNRIHLKNKKEAANKILKQWNMHTIRILGPEEL